MQGRYVSCACYTSEIEEKANSRQLPQKVRTYVDDEDEGGSHDVSRTHYLDA